MGITFHCEYCGKKIQAPDEAGGKWGKCPACSHKLYVPASDAGEELKLAPVDESDEAKQKELMAETYKLTQEILREREDMEGQSRPGVSAIGIGEKELMNNVILYLRRMADGDLNEASETAKLINTSGAKAIEILDRIALSEIPEPELADIPAQVLSGLIRELRNQIG